MQDYLNETYFETFRNNNISNHVALFLHGYPSDLGDRNADLAEFVFEKTKTDCYVIHYPGLGKSKGEFSFLKSLSAVDEFCIHLKSLGYSHIDFMGHSWGGFLALLSMKHWSENSNIALMSPFLFLPKGEELRNLVTAIYNETKEFLEPKTLEVVLLELIEMEEKNSRSKIISDLKTKNNTITFIQALDDVETPPKIAREFVSEVGKSNLNYIELDTDHSFFEKREELKEMLGKVLGEND